jgi:hypothetical protein
MSFAFLACYCLNSGSGSETKKRGKEERLEESER